MRDGGVYVLEYTHATEASAEGWLPRVRKIARDGTVKNLLTITPNTNIGAGEYSISGALLGGAVSSSFLAPGQG